MQTSDMADQSSFSSTSSAAAQPQANADHSSSSSSSGKSNKKILYVIEHMEPEVSNWCLMEYRAMRRLVGAENLVFTLMDKAVLAALPKDLEPPVRCFADEVLAALNVPKERICLLDPNAERLLEPADVDNFDVVLFGGILGADPPLDRTGELRVKGFPNRHLGKLQMTTNTAVDVCHRILSGTPFDGLKFVDWPEFRLSKYETTEMPFRYLADDRGKPIVPEDFLDILREDATIF